MDQLISNFKKVPLQKTLEKSLEGVCNPAPLHGEVCEGFVDLATTCPVCMTQMNPEHAHYRCPKCHYVDSCCFDR